MGYLKEGEAQSPTCSGRKKENSFPKIRAMQLARNSRRVASAARYNSPLSMEILNRTKQQSRRCISKTMRPGTHEQTRIYKSYLALGTERSAGTAYLNFVYYSVCWRKFCENAPLVVTLHAYNKTRCFTAKILNLRTAFGVLLSQISRSPIRSLLTIG